LDHLSGKDLNKPISNHNLYYDYGAGITLEAFLKLSTFGESARCLLIGGVWMLFPGA